MVACRGKYLAPLALVSLIVGCGGGGGGDTTQQSIPLEITPTTVDFGSVRSGESANRSVTIRNTGNSTVTGFAGGQPSDSRFTLANTCTSLAAGATCAYDFTYQPTSNGRTSVTSTTNTGVGKFDVALTGAGFGSALWVTPLRLNFGPVGVGSTSAQQIVTITNQGSTVLTNFAGGAPFDNQFGASQNCAGGVAPGASCQYFFTLKLLTFLTYMEDHVVPSEDIIYLLLDPSAAI